MPAMLLHISEGKYRGQGPLLRKKYILRHDDACETTLNPGFKWEELGAIGLSATRRTCTPGFRSLPVVVIKGQGVCFARRRSRQRMREQYSEAVLNAKAVRRLWGGAVVGCWFLVLGTSENPAPPRTKNHKPAAKNSRVPHPACDADRPACAKARVRGRCSRHAVVAVRVPC